MEMAGVLGRPEYLKAKMASYWTGVEQSGGLHEGPQSVSPGKPTMMSEVMEMSRLAAFIQAMRSRYQSRVYSRAIAFRMAVEPDWTGRWT